MAWHRIGISEYRKQCWAISLTHMQHKEEMSIWMKLTIFSKDYIVERKKVTNQFPILGQFSRNTWDPFQISWAHNPNLIKYTAFYMKNNNPIRSQFCTCHGSSVFMTCANLLSHWIISMIMKAAQTKGIVMRFQSWAHICFVKWVSDTWYMGWDIWSPHNQSISHHLPLDRGPVELTQVIPN